MAFLLSTQSDAEYSNILRNGTFPSRRLRVAISQESLIEAADFFEKSIRLDPNFTLAYCACESAQDLIYFWYDPTPERLARADQAVKTASRLQPDLAEVRLANARHLYYGYR